MTIIMKSEDDVAACNDVFYKKRHDLHGYMPTAHLIVLIMNLIIKCPLFSTTFGGCSQCFCA